MRDPHEVAVPLLALPVRMPPRGRASLAPYAAVALCIQGSAPGLTLPGDMAREPGDDRRAVPLDSVIS